MDISLSNLGGPAAGPGPTPFWRGPAMVDAMVPPIAEDGPGDADFRMMADALPALCWIARADGTVVWFNRRWYDYCGATPGAMAADDWARAHHPGILPQLKACWSAAIAAGDSFEMTVPLRGADGAFRPFHMRIAPLIGPDGAVARWFGVDVDMSEQARAEAALRLSQTEYAVLTNAMPQMVWTTRPDGFHDFYNDQWYAYTGVPYGSTDGEGWADVFHPDDQPRAWERWRHSLATGDPYEVEYRLKHHRDGYRWTLGRALPVRDDGGAIVRWIGTCTDIHAAKLDAEQNEILSQELSHRIKNIFSIIAGLIGLSARQDPSAKPFARAISERIATLGRAHEFARPHSDRSRPTIGAATLAGLLDQLFLPYAIDGVSRIAVTGDDPPVDDKGATPLALLFHELATNAAKYGALSTAEGRVAIAVAREGDTVRIAWRERGGPALAGPPAAEGFGTRLAALSVEQQLGGRLARTWHGDGLEVVVELPARGLARG